MEAVVGPEMPNNHKSTIPSIHRNRPSRTHFLLSSFIATGHHERIPPSRHSRVGGNLDARSTNHSTNTSSDLAGARVFP